VFTSFSEFAYLNILKQSRKKTEIAIIIPSKFPLSYSYITKAYSARTPTDERSKRYFKSIKQILFSIKPPKVAAKSSLFTFNGVMTSYRSSELTFQFESSLYFLISSSKGPARFLSIGLPDWEKFFSKNSVIPFPY